MPKSSPPPSGRGERVRLVDEQHLAHRLVDDLVDARRGLADEAGDEVGTRRLDDLGVRDDPEQLVDASEQARDRRLAGPGRAEERHVVGHVHGLPALRLALALDTQQRGEPAHLRLDRLEPDERVEVGHHLLEAVGRGRRRRDGVGHDRTRRRGRLAAGALPLEGLFGARQRMAHGRRQLKRGVEERDVELGDRLRMVAEVRACEPEPVAQHDELAGRAVRGPGERALRRLDRELVVALLHRALARHLGQARAHAGVVLARQLGRGLALETRREPPLGLRRGLACAFDVALCPGVHLCSMPAIGGDRKRDGSG